MKKGNKSLISFILSMAVIVNMIFTVTITSHGSGEVFQGYEAPIVIRKNADECNVNSGSTHQSTRFNNVAGAADNFYKNFVVKTGMTPPNNQVEFAFEVVAPTAGSYEFYAETSIFNSPDYYSTYSIEINNNGNIIIDSSQILESTVIVANELIKYRYFDIDLAEGVNSIVIKAQKTNNSVSLNGHVNYWNFNIGNLRVVQIPNEEEPSPPPFSQSVDINFCVVYPGNSDPGGQVHKSTYMNNQQGVGGLYNYKNFAVPSATAPPDNLLEFRFTVDVPDTGSYELYAETSRYDLPNLYSPYMININNNGDVSIGSAEILESTVLVGNDLIKYRYFDIDLVEGQNTIVIKAEKMSQTVNGNYWNFSMRNLIVVEIPDEESGDPTPTPVIVSYNINECTLDSGSTHKSAQINNAGAADGYYKNFVVNNNTNVPKDNQFAFAFKVTVPQAGSYKFYAETSRYDRPTVYSPYKVSINGGNDITINAAQILEKTPIIGDDLVRYRYFNVDLEEGDNIIVFKAQKMSNSITANGTTNYWHYNMGNLRFVEILGDDPEIPSPTPFTDSIDINLCLVHPDANDPGGRVHVSSNKYNQPGIGGSYNYKNFVVPTGTQPQSGLLEFVFTVNVPASGRYEFYAETSAYDTPSEHSPYKININGGADITLDPSKILESTTLIANTLIKYRYFDIDLSEGINTITFKAEQMSQAVNGNHWSFNMCNLMVVQIFEEVLWSYSSAPFWVDNGDGTIDITAVVDNVSDISRDVIMTVAVYEIIEADVLRLKAVKAIPETVEETQAYLFENLPKNENYLYKVFFWENESYTPLLDPNTLVVTE